MNTLEKATVLVALATFLAVLVALFREEIISLWRHPNLVGRINLAAPDCVKTELSIFNPQTGVIIDHGGSYYFRIWVENKGKLRAEQVQVFANKLLKNHADGIFRLEEKFLPMNLKWSHSQRPNEPEIFASGISPLMGKHCDIGRIVHRTLREKNMDVLPEFQPDISIFALETEVTPSTSCHLLSPGIYHLDLKIAAANSKPMRIPGKSHTQSGVIRTLKK